MSPWIICSVSDSELISHYRQTGDLTHLAELFLRYHTLVYGVCVKYLKDREEARDATMQVFEKLVGTLLDHTVENFKSWVYVTTRNHCLMQIRARKGKFMEEFSSEHMENQFRMHPEEEPLLEENLTKLEKCLDTLIAEQKQCVQLFFIQEKCYKEVAIITGYELKSVKSYIQNGKRNLKQCMERHD